MESPRVPEKGLFLVFVLFLSLSVIVNYKLTIQGTTIRQGKPHEAIVVAPPSRADETYNYNSAGLIFSKSINGFTLLPYYVHYLGV